MSIKLKKETGFEIKETPDKGQGVFATKRFKINETIMVGTIEKELDGNNSHASQIGVNRFVLHAGFMSTVNHSCDPNCGIKVNSSGAHDLVAFREIKIGEEITYDYAMRNLVTEHFPKVCLCKSENCRIRITGWRDLPAERKKAYGSFVAPYLTEFDKNNDL